MGIPGYTGFHPGYARAPIPIKVAKHLGRQPDAETRLAAATTTAPRAAASEYRATFPAYSAQQAARDPATAPGGYWFEERSRQAAGRQERFLGTTTYREELLHPSKTAAKQLAASAGVPTTLVGYATARAAAVAGTRRSMSAGAASTGPLDGTGVTASGRPLVGYQTTYSCANRPVLEARMRAALAADPTWGSGVSSGRVATGTSGSAITNSSSISGTGAAGSTWGSAVDGRQVAAATGPAAAASAATPQQQQHQQQQPSSPSCRTASAGARFEGASSYSRDFVGDPMARLPAGGGPRDACTLGATTADLNLGTTRGCLHVPGYTGFVPAAASNVAARTQGAGAAPRAGLKQSMLLSGLDQYGRGRLPHYTGYKPKGGGGVSSEQPAQGPTDATTQGFLNLQLLSRGAQPRDPKHCINSSAGLMSFFSSGTNGSAGEPSIRCVTTLVWCGGGLCVLLHVGPSVSAALRRADGCRPPNCALLY